MIKAVLVIGSNCGPREALVMKGLDYLGSQCSLCRRSDIYETPDCLGTGRPYLNAVVEVSTEMDEALLNAGLKALERRCGRDAGSRDRGEVPLDIDIVVWNGLVRRPSDFAASYFRRGFLSL